VSAGRQQPSDDLLTYLRMLVGDSPQPGQFFDVRWVIASGRMGRRFLSALRVHDAGRVIARLASMTDVYVGVALRDGRRGGGKGAISGSHLLYIECDDPHAQRSLRRFPHPPTMELASGTPNHLHLYWRLCERAARLQVESANRRLARALDGDLASVDIARILRPPDTLNHKHDPPREVALLAYRPRARYRLGELTRSLGEDPSPRAAAIGRTDPRQVARTARDRALLAIPAAEYVRVLANVAPNRAGKVLCPFHEDTEPSLHLYPDGTFYCFGSGCARGGTIFDFAAATWGLGTRERDFLELRRRLTSTFGIAARPDHTN